MMEHIISLHIRLPFLSTNLEMAVAMNSAITFKFTADPLITSISVDSDLNQDETLHQDLKTGICCHMCGISSIELELFNPSLHPDGLSTPT